MGFEGEPQAGGKDAHIKLRIPTAIMIRMLPATDDNFILFVLNILGYLLSFLFNILEYKLFPSFHRVPYPAFPSSREFRQGSSNYFLFFNQYRGPHSELSGSCSNA